MRQQQKRWNKFDTQTQNFKLTEPYNGELRAMPPLQKINMFKCMFVVMTNKNLHKHKKIHYPMSMTFCEADKQNRSDLCSHTLCVVVMSFKSSRDRGQSARYRMWDTYTNSTHNSTQTFNPRDFINGG